MVVNDLLIPVRQKLDDMQKLIYSDIDLIYFLNRVISDLSVKLSAEKDPELINTFTVTGITGVARPADFISFAGSYPLETYTNAGSVMLKHLDTSFTGNLNVRYFATKPPVSALTDVIPFTKQQDISALIDYAVNLASNRNPSTQAENQVK